MWPEIIFYNREDQADYFNELRNPENTLKESVWLSTLWYDPDGSLLIALAKSAELGNAQAEARRQMYVKLSMVRLWIEERAAQLQFATILMGVIMYLFVTWQSAVIITILDAAVAFYLRRIEIFARVREGLNYRQYQ